MNFKINSTDMSFSFSDFGGELISAVSKEGLEYIWQGDERSWNRHAPILFPFCGRLKNSEFSYKGKGYEMGCHGFLPKSVMKANRIADNKIEFSLTDSESTRAIFPFPFKITVCYEAKGSTLDISTDIKNTGSEALPFMYGVHPGFNIPLESSLSLEDYYLDFGCDNALITPLHEDKCFIAGLPSVYNFNDGLFRLNESELESMGTAIFSHVSEEVKLFSPRGNHGVKIKYSDSFNYFCVWKFPSADASFVCLEPWSGIPQDGILDEIIETRPSMARLAPGETQNYTLSITFI